MFNPEDIGSKNQINWFFFIILSFSNFFWVVIEPQGSINKKKIVAIIFLTVVYYSLTFARQIITNNNLVNLRKISIVLLIVALLSNLRFLPEQRPDMLVLTIIFSCFIRIFFPIIDILIQNWDPRTVVNWRAEDFQQLAICEIVILIFRSFVI